MFPKFCYLTSNFTFLSKRVSKVVFRVVLFFVLVLVSQDCFSQEKEMYALLSTDKKTLTFYYDNKKDTRNDGEVFTNWRTDEVRSTVEIAIFDKSFEDCRPNNTSRWFNGFSKLTEIKDIKYLNTEEVTSMVEMFFGCDSLNEIDLSNFKTGKAYDIEDMFAYCSSLTDLDLSSFVFSESSGSVMMNLVAGFFGGCSSLEHIEWPSGYKVINIDSRGLHRMFAGCSSLTYLDLSSFNTEHVNHMDEMFYGCTNLTYVNLSSFNTEKVTNMNNMFNGCSSLKTLDLRSFNTARLAQVSGMFYGCSRLERIAVSDKWKPGGINFSGCELLEGCKGSCIQNTRFDHLGNIDEGESKPGFLSPDLMLPYAELSEDGKTFTFYYDELKSQRKGTTYRLHEYHKKRKDYDGFYIPSGVWFSDESFPEWVYRYSGSSSPMNEVTKVVFDPSFKQYRPITCAGWFAGFGNLTEIEGFDNLVMDDVTDLSAMFYGCTSLASLDLSNFNTSKVTDMSCLFLRCKNLTSLEVGNFDTQIVTCIPFMFGECSSLKTIDVSKLNTNNVISMAGLFLHCSGLTSLDITMLNTDKVETMSGMFCGCSSLTKLDVTKLNTSNVEFMEHMFEGCSGLTEIDLSGFNTDKVHDMDFMFSGCSGLTSLDVTKFNTSNVWDMSFMFAGCSNLKEIDVRGFNTENVQFMGGMFKDCIGLTKLDVSSFNTSKIYSFGYNGDGFAYASFFYNRKVYAGMFEGCTGLTNLDLSNFDTRNAENMFQMFKDCSNLKEIFVLNKWNTDKVGSRFDEYGSMFDNCTNLVGFKGTVCHGGGKEFAHIDGGTSNPGYLSGITLQPDFSGLTINPEKFYDGTTSVDYTGTVSIKNPDDIKSGDDVDFSFSVDYNTKDIDADKIIVLLELTGTDAPYYAWSEDRMEITSGVLIKPLSADFDADAFHFSHQKLYDGTNKGLFEKQEVAILNAVAGDDVKVSLYSLDFDNAEVGDNKLLTATFVITGESDVVKNYVFPSGAEQKVFSDGVIYDYITLSLNDDHFTYGNSKIGVDIVGVATCQGNTVPGTFTYNNNGVMLKPSSQPQIVEIVGFTPDNTSVYRLPDNISKQIEVLVSKKEISTELNGINSLDQLADLTALLLTSTKVYDGTRKAECTGEIKFKNTTDIVDGDKVFIKISSAEFNTKDIDASSITITYELDGDDKDNYDLSASSTTYTDGVKIFPVSAIFDINDFGIALEKEFDGTTDGFSLKDEVPIKNAVGDEVVNVKISSLQFSDNAIGDGKTLTAKFVLSGQSDVIKNYILDAQHSETIFTDKVCIKVPVIKIGADMSLEVESELFCTKGIVLLTLDYTGMPDNYTVSFADGFIPTISGDLSSNQRTIEIPLPDNIQRGIYSGTVTLSDKTGTESASSDFAFELKMARKSIFQLYENMIFVSDETPVVQWYRNGEAIDRATMQYYYNESGLSGSYLAKISTKDGSELQTCPFEVATTITKRATSVMVYPNPVQELQTFVVEIVDNYSESAKGDIYIYNTNGSLVKHLSNVQRVNHFQLKSGNYSGVFIQNGEKTSFKVIVR